MGRAPRFAVVTAIAVIALLAVSFLQAAGADCAEYSHHPRELGMVGLTRHGAGVAISGNRAYVANHESGLQIIDLTNPSAPSVIDTVDTSGDALDVSVVGSHAYVADIGSLKVIDLSLEPPAVVGSVNTPGNAVAVEVSGNYAYVADYTYGLAVIDVTNPGSPTLAGRVDTPGVASDVAVSGTYAYIADTNTGFFVMDVSDPHNPQMAGGLYVPGAPNRVAVSGDFAYLVAGTDFVVLDLSNPHGPVEAGRLQVAAQISDVAVSGAYAFVSKNAYDVGMYVIAITDPQNPRIVGRVPVTFPQTAAAIAVSGSLAACATNTFEVHGALDVIDVTWPEDPPAVGPLALPGLPEGMAVSGDYAYVAAYDSGLQVIEMTDPMNPHIVGSVDTPGTACGVGVSGHLACLSDGTALQVIDVTDPALPRIIGSADVSDGYDVAISGRYAYVAAGAAGLVIVDMADPRQPRIVGGVNTDGDAYGIAVTGSYAYVGSQSCLEVIDVTDPQSPLILSALSGSAYDVVIGGAYAYVAGSSLNIVDISDPRNPRYVCGGVGSGIQDVALKGRYVYATGDAGVQAIDISNPQSPLIVGTLCGAIGWVHDVACSEGRAFAIDSHSFWVLPLQCDPASGIRTDPAAQTVPTAGVRFLPNPTRGSTMIRWDALGPGTLEATVYDPAGRLIRTLSGGFVPAGLCRLAWDGLDADGHAVRSGVYLVRVRAGQGTRAGRVVIVK